MYEIINGRTVWMFDRTPRIWMDTYCRQLLWLVHPLIRWGWLTTDQYQTVKKDQYVLDLTGNLDADL